MSDLRAQLAVALGSSGHVQDKLDAVMAVVGQVERERDEARASVEHLRGDYRRIRKDRDRLLLAWRSARRRANGWRAAATTEIPRWDEDAVVRRFGFLQPDQCGKCGEVNPRLAEALWLHAEAVWQRDQFRANEVENAELANDIFMAAGSKLASAVVLPEPVQRLVDWHLSYDGANVSPMPPQSEVREAMESWRPATVEAAPTTPAEPFGRRQCRWWFDTKQCCEWNTSDSDYCDHHTTLRIAAFGSRFARWESYGSDGPDVDPSPSTAGVSGTGTEAAPLADLHEAEWQQFHADVTSARGTGTEASDG